MILSTLLFSTTKRILLILGVILSTFYSPCYAKASDKALALVVVFSGVLVTFQWLP